MAQKHTHKKKWGHTWGPAPAPAPLPGVRPPVTAAALKNGMVRMLGRLGGQEGTCLTWRRWEIRGGNGIRGWQRAFFSLSRIGYISTYNTYMGFANEIFFGVIPHLQLRGHDT